MKDNERTILREHIRDLRYVEQRLNEQPHLGILIAVQDVLKSLDRLVEEPPTEVAPYRVVSEARRVVKTALGYPFASITNECPPTSSALYWRLLDLEHALHEFDR